LVILLLNPAMVVIGGTSAKLDWRFSARRMPRCGDRLQIGRELASMF